MTDLDLFSQSREPEVDAPYQLGSDTSRDAAREIQPRTQAMRANILTAIRAAGSRGVTRKELEGITGYVTPTLCARLNELEFELGEIRKWTVGDPPKTVKREGCAVYLSKSVRVAA
jgi:hypothetical protein